MDARGCLFDDPMINDAMNKYHYVLLTSNSVISQISSIDMVTVGWN